MDNFMYEYGRWLLSEWFTMVCVVCIIIGGITSSKLIKNYCELTALVWFIYGAISVSMNM
jgi:hypothetical protein